MLSIRRISPMFRAIGTMGAVAAVVGGVTFANLQSNTVALADNTISTITDSLRIWDGSSWNAHSATGFTVTNLVPGTPASNPFFLQNLDTNPLNLSVMVPVAPTLTNISDASKVKVTIIDDHLSIATNTDLAALESAPVPLSSNPFPAGATGDSGTPGTEGNFTLKFDVDPSGITPGTSASVGSFDLQFSGTE